MEKRKICVIITKNSERVWGKMKEKLKKFLLFVSNPRLLLCVGIAWMITNGWSYVMMGMGTYFGIGWMIAVSGSYLAFLWFPFSPEKLATLAIALALLRWLFPRDQKTLAVLYDMRDKAKAAILRRKEKKQEKKDSQKECE